MSSNKELPGTSSGKPPAFSSIRRISRPALFGLGLLLVIAVVAGSGLFRSWQKSEVLENFQVAIAADDLRSAESAIERMNELDPDDQRFVSAAALFDVIRQSQETFFEAESFAGAGNVRSALAAYRQVSPQDSARFDESLRRIDALLSQFEEATVAEAESLLDSDPRQAFWTIENALDVLGDSVLARQVRERAAMATIDTVDAQLRALVEEGDYVRAARLASQTSEALLEYSSVFAERTAWLTTELNMAQQAALQRSYSWQGGPNGDTRYFDSQAVRYTRSGDAIVWIASDALELHLYQSAEGLSLYLKAMLYHPSWVRADRVVATIDGVDWDMGFPQDAIERYEGSRNAWEGAWRPVGAADIDPLMDIALSTTTSVTFSGSDGDASFSLNSADKAGLSRMLLAYLALAGDDQIFW